MRFETFRYALLASISSAVVVVRPAFAQQNAVTSAQTDQPGQPGPAGPAGQAVQGDTAVPASRAAPAGSSTQQQDGLAEIVVTAERRSSTVQRTAISVSVRTGDELRKEGKVSLRDILENVPGVTGGEPQGGPVPPGGTDTVGTGIVIRGLKSVSGSDSDPPAVAVYTDDVYEGIGDSYDVDRVEILRGPQGTLYGRSATGGVISVHTRNPDPTRWEGFGLAEIGDYNLRHFSAALNAPIVDDKLALRVSGDYYGRNGYESDYGLGRTIGKNLRLKILAKPADSVSILLGAALQDNETASGGKIWYIDPNGNRYATTVPTGSGKNRFRQFWADIQWDLGFATLTYIPAYRSWHQQALSINQSPAFLTSTPVSVPKDDFITNEARLSSDPAARLKWQIGMLQYSNDITRTNEVYILPINFRIVSSVLSRKTDALGVFGEATYSLADAWRVTGGLRYDYTKVALNETYTGPTGTTLILSGDAALRRFKNWTYRLRTEYDLSPQSLLYASYSTGFSPGSVTAVTGATGEPIALELKDETIRSFEVGSKNRLFNNQLQANISAFYYTFSGYETEVDLDPGPGLGFGTIASPQHSYGGELELVYQPTPRDRAAFNAAYVDARFVDQPALWRSLITNKTTIGVPPFTASLSYSHRFDLPGGSGFTITGDGRYLSGRYTGTISPQQQAMGQAQLIYAKRSVVGNLTADWASADRHYSLGAYVRNISDQRYVTDGAILDVGGAQVSLYQPRTFGVIGSFNF